MRGGIPEAPEAIDPGWLEAALAPRHPDVHVAGVEVVERREATNCHARLRVRYREPAGAPEWLFCKLLPTDPERRAAIAATGMGPREARFYARLARTLGMRVPTCHAAGWDESGAFVLLLEDLGCSGCTISYGAKGLDPDAAAVALEDLAALHARFEDPDRRRREAAWVEPPLHDPSYAAAMLGHALAHHRERLGEPFARIAELYLSRPEALHALWLEGPSTVIHGDPHIGNLFDDGGRVGFLDWGILSTGTPLRDVSYFLCMALGIEERRAHERDLWCHYLGARRAAGAVDIDFDEAWRAHRVQAAYTVVASCQIATFPERSSASRRVFAEAFLARAQAAVEDLECAAALAARGVGVALAR